MERRKIQLVAGTSYSVSLPKKWIEKNGLGKHREVNIIEMNNGSLNISAQKDNTLQKNIDLDIEDIKNNLGPILLAIYYGGAENITLHTKNLISKNQRTVIRRAVLNMTGTEISYEDKKKISINILLDKSKVNVNQLLYRLCLLLDSSLHSLIEEVIDKSEFEINESEIDRLYNLIHRILNLSLTDSNILASSKINALQNIPAYFIISKKLENIGDLIYNLSNRNLGEKKIKNACADAIGKLSLELDICTKNILTEFPSIDQPINTSLSEPLYKLLEETKDSKITETFIQIAHYLEDIRYAMIDLSINKTILN